MIALEGALEGSATAGRATNGVWLLGVMAQAVVVHHEVIGLLLALLATPNPPRNESQTTQDNGTTNTDDNSNDGVARCSRHARSSIVVVAAATLEARWRGRRRDLFGCVHGAVRVSSCNDLRDVMGYLLALRRWRGGLRWLRVVVVVTVAVAVSVSVSVTTAR